VAAGPEIGDAYPASLSELARRLQRVEDKMDERIATVDMLRASEKVASAREFGYAAEVASLRERVSRMETANLALTRMVIGAFLGLLVQTIVLVITATSKG
jgi:hypothetical protein